MTDREKVLDYLKHRFGKIENIKPLVFYIRPDGNFFIPYGVKSVDDVKDKIKSLENKRLILRTIVVRVMEIAEFLPTIELGYQPKFNSDWQCRAGARRTAVDIWRIIINFRPDVTIFDVMRVLYNITTKGSRPSVITSYCSMIQQRTFRLERGRTHIYNSNIDEFHINNFAAWKEIR